MQLLEVLPEPYALHSPKESGSPIIQLSIMTLTVVQTAILLPPALLITPFTNLHTI